MAMFLAIHVFPNVFPPGGSVKNWSYIWFEFSFDIFVMTAYGIITRGLRCDIDDEKPVDEWKLVANGNYRCNGTFFRRYLAFTAIAMALILLSVLSFSRCTAAPLHTRRTRPARLLTPHTWALTGYARCGIKLQLSV